MKRILHKLNLINLEPYVNLYKKKEHIFPPKKITWIMNKYIG